MHTPSFGFFLSDTGSRPVYMTRDGGLTWQAQREIVRRQGHNPVSLSTTREGHCYVLVQKPQPNTTDRPVDTIYYFRNIRPRFNTITASQPKLSALVQNITLHPNPATLQTQINGISPRTRWRLLSPIGRVEREGQGSGNLPLGGLPKGLYMLMVESDNQWQLAQKLVVE